MPIQTDGHGTLLPEGPPAGRPQSVMIRLQNTCDCRTDDVTDACPLHSITTGRYRVPWISGIHPGMRRCMTGFLLD
jgi:hypothetical protein